MSKTIVFCADGTWNGPDEPTANGDGNSPEGTGACEPYLTNVCKLFAWLNGDLQPPGSSWGSAEMEKSLHDASGTPTQIAKYVHGVGNSQHLLGKVTGGAFGVGVVARIARGYTYISRNFVPGDSIVIVGFSRGAYTARALAGLIAGEGLLWPDFAAIDDDRRYDTAVAAWYRWRHGHDATLRRIADGLTEFLQIHSAFSHPRSLDASSFVPAKITAVAVWETVGVLGIPEYVGGAAVDLFRFRDLLLNPNISLGLHAVSLDEQRKPLAPTLWAPNPHVTQALFPGGHCDIGGGYAEHGLSDGPLLWVVDRLKHPDVGLKFAFDPPVEVKSDPLAVRHREWVSNPIWLAAGVASRTFPAEMVVNDAVRQRMDGASEAVFGAEGVQRGTVKWFNDAKGFGFITPDGGGEDLFAHFSPIQMNGFKTLKESQKVAFEVKTGGNMATSAEDASPVAVLLDVELPPQSRQIRVTGYSPSGELITVFAPETKYALHFCVAAPSDGNLARGHLDVTSVPNTGLRARWIVTSANVELLAVFPVGTVVKRGDTWLAEFDLIIPGHGDSAIVTLDVCTTEQSGELMVTLLVAGEEYRKLTVTLGFGARVTDDVVCTAPDHLNLGTYHEWTTPPEHLALNVIGPLVCVSTIRGTKDYGTMEWIGNSTLLKSPIDRVRRALERFRVAAEAHLNDLDVADMDRRLHSNRWKPYDWNHLPGDADHEGVPDLLASGAGELRALANEGYRLFDTCFPRNSELRSIIADLKPGSRLDFVWTSRGAVDWVSHVPWALMYLEPVKASEPVDCERFLGLRYRIGSKSWEPNAPSAALGDPALVHALHFLYWGTDPRDEVAAQSRWHRNEFGKRTQQCFLPDGDIRDFKGQLVAALEAPKPHPAGILYFYCHCSVKDGSDPVLQFGETAKSSDTVEASEIYSGPLEACPLVFANACTTVAADPLGTSELESRFFARNIRAFLGTETKVPVALASRFAWLFFQFFFRTVDPAPMAAGEALAQARRFLWTQYHNPGGLFYCLVNRYDLYLASDEEVAQLQRK